MRQSKLPDPVDAPSGTYDVTLVLGDTGNFSHDQMGVFLEGAQVGTVSTAGGEVTTVTYSTQVSDGQLTLRIADLGGSDVNVVINGLEVVWIGPETAGPRVIAAGPTGNATGPVDRVTLSFSEPIEDGTFTLDDVVSLDGPNGAITPTAVNKLDTTNYDVVFAAQSTLGDYSLTIGPMISDLSGNLMNQDGDGINGEPVQDQYTATFTLEPFSATFDFGTATSPLQAGYTGVDPTTGYTSSRGYGWQSTSVLAVDRWTG